jgi:hypothetical protein
MARHSHFDAQGRMVPRRHGAALVSQGAESTRVHADGKGNTKPIADNSTAEGRQKNKRVDVEVVGTRLLADSRREKVTFVTDVWFE